MEFTSIILSILLIVLTYLFLFARTAKKQSVEVDVNGEKVIRLASHQEGLVSSIGAVTTLHELFVDVVKKFPNSNATGTRKKTGTKKDKDGKDVPEFGDFEWKTYSELKIRSDNLGSGLYNLGARPGDRIGIFSTNREDWLVTQQGCFAHSLAIVSFYETLGKETLKYVADHSEIKIAVCNIESLSKMFEMVSGKDPVKGIKHIVVMDKFGDDKREKAKEYGVEIHFFGDVEADGAKNPVSYHEPKADDISTIMYTSGTTGTPKGVIITHKNIVAEVAAIRKVVFIRTDEAYLSYLPLAHIFERVILTACMSFGAAIGFFRGDTRYVVDDMKVLKPTIFVGVPRIFDRARATIMNTLKTQPPAAQYAFKVGFQLKKFLILYMPWVPTALLDKYIFAKTKQALGGKVEFIISAGAPLSYELEVFMRVCFGCVVSQAYGLTESSGAASVKYKDDTTVGHLGPPMPCNEFRLDDLPDMGYTKNDYPHPRGELLIRGHNIATGYYKDDEKTDESFKNGWFYTGDIAEWTNEGVFRVIDRKKNMFKLAQGEYVAAEKVEGKLADGASVIEQIFVYGDSQKTSLIAVVVPKESELKSAAKGGDLAKMCESKEAKEFVAKKIAEAGKAAGLHGFEIPVKVHLHPEAFTVENDLMTPTMKLKRQSLQNKFKKEIAQLYKEIGDR